MQPSGQILREDKGVLYLHIYPTRLSFSFCSSLSVSLFLYLYLSVCLSFTLSRSRFYSFSLSRSLLYKTTINHYPLSNVGILSVESGRYGAVLCLRQVLQAAVHRLLRTVVLQRAGTIFSLSPLANPMHYIQENIDFKALYGYHFTSEINCFLKKVITFLYKFFHQRTYIKC